MLKDLHSYNAALHGPVDESEWGEKDSEFVSNARGEIEGAETGDAWETGGISLAILNR